MSCIVKHCKNIRRFKPEGITFHRFPRDRKMLNKWLSVLENTENNVNRIQCDLNTITNKSICSRHFRETDFIRTPTRVFLKPNAVPSILLEQVVKISSCITIRESFTAPSSSPDLKPDCILSGNGIFLTDPNNIHCDISDREKMMIVQQDHSYNTFPEDYKVKYETLREIHLKTKKKLYNANVKIKNLKKKVLSLQLTICDLKKK